MSDLTPILLFPSAGSFGTEFGAVLREHRPRGRIIRYPNRDGITDSISSFSELTAVCADKVVAASRAQPVHLVGHSFGAYVAYAVAMALVERSIEVASLVVTGANAPSWPRQIPNSVAETNRYLETLDPVGFSAVDDEIRVESTELAYSDLRLLQEFSAGNKTALQCAVYAAGGETDPLVTEVGVREWTSTTVGDFESRIFFGGHSDFLKTHEFVKWLKLK